MRKLRPKLSWIRISVETGSRKLYQKIQEKDDYNKVIVNALKLYEFHGNLSRETNIGVHTMINEENLIFIIIQKILEKSKEKNF